jgi:hypothetical protein
MLYVHANVVVFLFWKKGTFSLPLFFLTFHHHRHHFINQVHIHLFYHPVIIRMVMISMTVKPLQHTFVPKEKSVY